MIRPVRKWEWSVGCTRAWGERRARMGEFFAWAATGLVAGLELWADTKNNNRAEKKRNSADQAVAHRQRFFLRQRDGQDIEILLIDSGMAFRNGHAVTAVWAAGKGAPYGHCIYLENHTTGAIARLPENIALIRPEAGFWQVLFYGFAATFMAGAALLLWLFVQRGSSYLHHKMFWISAGISLSLLFVIGIVVSKLVCDYIKADDDQKIWMAADKALANARRVLLQKPVTSRYK
jgi:hypothetical protein